MTGMPLPKTIKDLKPPKPPPPLSHSILTSRGYIGLRFQKTILANKIMKILKDFERLY